MPSKNVRKPYVKGAYYHIYNRGVEKRKIFQASQDYKVFLKYLKEHLSLPDKTKPTKTFCLRGRVFKGIPRLPKSYHGEIDLIAFCLMPNHFHLLIKQNSIDSMEKFMRSLLTRYSMYFNKKYDRVGSLFQGPYKACLITQDDYLLHLTRYVHLNPSEYTKSLEIAYSSYSNYLGLRNTKWVKPKVVLSFFTKTNLPFLRKFNTYKNFVEKYKKDASRILGDLTLE